MVEQFQNLVPVEHREQRVLTTAQLAEFYGCPADNIKRNFNRNRDRFVDGKHFFKLEGDELRSFRKDFPEAEDEPLRDFMTNCQSQNLRGTICHPQISSKTRTLYLWTERGAARHAKMISTDKAWEVFEALEDCYFRRQKVVPAADTPSVRRDGQLKDACVYVLLMSNGTVKIGQSANVRNRASKIKRQTGLTVDAVYFTSFMPREAARLIEWACHENFSSRRAEGEFFSVNFKTACDMVDVFTKNVHLLPLVMKLEREKVLATVIRFFADEKFF